MNYTNATIPMDQHIRNQMSLMAWIMAFLCGWVMFVSAYARGADSAKSVEKTTIATVDAPAQ